MTVSRAMTGLRTWFAGRSLREKRLLLVMAALAVRDAGLGADHPAGPRRPVERARAPCRRGRSGSARRRRAVDAIQRSQRARPPPLDRHARRRGARARPTRRLHARELDADGPSRVRVDDPVGAAGGAGRAGSRGSKRAGILVDTATLTDNGDRTVGVAAGAEGARAMRRIRLAHRPGRAVRRDAADRAARCSCRCGWRSAGPGSARRG